MSLASCLSKAHFQETFPNILSVVIFITYMVVSLQQAFLATASKSNDGTYPYNPTTVVLLTEVLKLILASIFYMKRYECELR